MSFDVAGAHLGRAALRRVLGNAGLLLGGRSVNAVLGLGYMALAARGLGVTGFGVLVLIHALTQFLGDVVKFQSWQTVIHYGAAPLAEGRTDEFQRVFRFTLLLDLISGVAGMVIGIVGMLAFSGRLGVTAEQAPAAAFYVLSLAFMVSATPLGLLRLFDRFDVMARQTALVSLVRLAGTGVAYGLNAPLEGYLLAWAAGTAAGFVYLATASLAELRLRKMLTQFPWRGPLGGGLPGIWKFAFTTNAIATLDIAFTHAVTLTVGALVGPAQAGLWRIGRQVADAIAKPAKLLVPALYPELARFRAGGREGLMGRLALHLALLAGGFGLVLLAITAAAGRPLLSLVMGPGFAPAAELMTWQVAAAVIGVFALPLEPMLVSLGRAGAALRVRLAVSVAFLAILPWIVQRLGAAGAAMALPVAAAVLAVGMLLALFVGAGAKPWDNKVVAKTQPDA